MANAALPRVADPLVGRLAEAASRARPLVHAVAPINWDAELGRLLASRRVGRSDEPRFVYAPPRRNGPSVAELERLADALDAEGNATAAEAAHDLALEARIAEAVGTPRLASLARLRFGSSPEDDARAARWASAPAIDDDDERIVSDDERSPRSLVSVLRAEIGRLRLPIRVIVRAGMASLAASGEGVVLVAAGRLLRPRDATRTTLHEIEGHVLPALERRGTSTFRTPRDADREEGAALAVEKSFGFLDDLRRKELGLRHVAARLAHEEAPFDAIVDQLESLGAESLPAVRIACRALRGGGLGRERVYLPALWTAERRGA